MTEQLRSRDIIAAPPPARGVELDPSQRRVLDAPADEALVVVGAPGSGKTTLLIELLAHRVAGGSPADAVLALVPGRAQAASLRDRLAARIGGTVSGSRARTLQSLAFEVVREHRAFTGELAPALLTGADEDAMIRELIAGRGVGAAGEYGFVPPITDEVLALAGFRSQLRDLKAAMSEYDVTPGELASHAGVHPAWHGAAALIQELQSVLEFKHTGIFDVPGLLLEAASILQSEAPRGRLAADRLRLVAVDDAQELTEAGRRLLVALEERGVTIVTFGDPDIATGVFRGGGAELASGWRQDDQPQPTRVVLERVHRHGAGLREIVAGITGRIGVRGEGRQRAAVAGAGVGSPAADAPVAAAADAPAEDSSAAEGSATASSAEGDSVAAGIARTAVVDSPAAEARLIANELRRLHLKRGVAWSDMAVLVRSTSAIPTLARLLARGDVPTSAVRPPDPAADPAVVAIMQLAAVAADPEALTASTVESVLASPLFGVDALRFRQLRRALRLREHEGGGNRPTDELIVEAVALPAGHVGLDFDEARPSGVDGQPIASLPTRHPAVVGLRRLSSLLHRAVAVARVGAADEVLWAIWEGAGVSGRWREQSLRGGPEGAAADARLDAVVALFDAAKRAVEREPEVSVATFVTSWAARDVAADSLARRAIRDAVTLATPASVVGREFRAVVVAGVNDGVWPNLRLRDSLLGAGRLVELITSSVDEQSSVDRRRDVLNDESRMFAQAVSRAREWLLVTAVESDDSAPSVLFRRLPAPRLDVDRRALPATLRGLTAQLRRELRGKAASGQPIESEATALAKLAIGDAPGAHPDAWHGQRPLSSERPLVELGDAESIEAAAQTGEAGETSAASAVDEPPRISVSPSGIEMFETCGVNWFVSRHGGDTTNESMALGTLVHAGAEFDFATPGARLEYLRGRLDELQPESSWRAAALERRLERMADALADFLADRRHAGVDVLGAERGFTVEVPVELDGKRVVVQLRGKADRIEVSAEGDVRVVDFKTGKTPIPVDEAESNAQLASYQFALRRGRVEAPEMRDVDSLPAPPVDPGGTIEVRPDRVSGAELIYLGRGRATDRPQSAMTDVDELAFQERLVAAAFGMIGLPLPRQHGEPGSTPTDGPGTLADEIAASVASGAPATFLAHPKEHCEATFGGSTACRIHTIAEVTE